MRSPLLLILCLFLCQPAFAGSKEKKADSLKRALAGQKDTARVLTLIKLSQTLFTLNKDSALHYSLMLKKEAEAWGKPERICDAYVVMGSCYHALFQADSAMHYKKLALAVAEKAGFDKGVANACNDIGFYFKERGEPDSAIIYTLRAIRIREHSNEEKALGTSYTNLALLYYTQQDFSNALLYYRKAEQVFRKYRKEGDRALVLNNIAALYDEIRQYDSALFYYTIALHLRDSLNDPEGISQTKLNMGYTYKNMGDYARAGALFSDALAIKLEIGDKDGEVACRLDMADNYRLMKKFAQAEIHLVRADSLAEELGQKEIRRDVYLEYYRLYSDEGKFEPALRYLEKYQSLKDSIMSDEKLKVIEDLKTKYETDKKESENRLLKEKAKLRELALEKEENQKMVLYAGIGVLAIILALAVYAYSLKIRSNRQITRQNSTLRELNKKLIDSEEELTELNRTKDKLFSVISHDLSNPVKAISNYNQALLVQKETLSREELAASLEKLNHAIHPLQGFLDNLLHWSALQRSGITLKPEAFPVQEIVNETVSLYEAYCLLKKIRITVTGESPALHTDKNMFRLILRNLVGNAIKFSPAGSEVKIETKAENGSVTISVSDCGPGIAEEKKQLLLAGKPVESEKGTLAETGTGLGISLVQEYLAKLNGKLEIETKTGTGTTFRVRIR